jgi:hypothetical protein
MRSYFSGITSLIKTKLERPIGSRSWLSPPKSEKRLMLSVARRLSNVKPMPGSSRPGPRRLKLRRGKYCAERRRTARRIGRPKRKNVCSRREAASKVPLERFCTGRNSRSSDQQRWKRKGSPSYYHHSLPMRTMRVNLKRITKRSRRLRGRKGSSRRRAEWWVEECSMICYEQERT